MSFFIGKLTSFDLCKMNEEIGENINIKKCCNGISTYLNEEEKNKPIEELLKHNGKLYYLFGRRKEKYLSCINDKNYLIDDEIEENSQGINMSDAYINYYEDINLGFLISYDNRNINIEAAIEGEAIGCRKYEAIDDCGDLNKEMKDFISKYEK